MGLPKGVWIYLQSLPPHHFTRGNEICVFLFPFLDTVGSALIGKNLLLKEQKRTPFRKEAKMNMAAKTVLVHVHLIRQHALFKRFMKLG